MVASSSFTEKPLENKRDETLKISQIDQEYLEKKIDRDLQNFRNTHEEFFEQRQDWLLGLRDLRYQYREGYFEQSSDLHVPFSLIMSKAMHARLFQIFSAGNIWSVEATNINFQDQEETIKFFMNWVTTKWTNRGAGHKDFLDRWIKNIVDEGTGIAKLVWDRWEREFVDLDIVTEETEQVDISTGGLEGEQVDVEEGVPEAKAKVKNVKVKRDESAPRMGVVKLDDFFMPAGFLNVQEAPWIAHRVTLDDEQLKLRARQKRFDKDVVQEALDRRRTANEDSTRSDQSISQDTRRRMEEMEGVARDSGQPTHEDLENHDIYEWYGKAHVEKDVDDDTFEDIDKSPKEVVIWYHSGIRKILGWTYLDRISPSGRRPFYKVDFMPSEERAFGIGIGELLYSLNNHIDAVHNLKLDNGVLSSMQFGFYRAGSSFKPDTFRLRPGDLLPMEDVNDVKFANVPFLGQFGENEELVLTGYGEKLLAINDINLGNLTGRGVAGALRNATGANFVDRQANIQLNPHIDRIAREFNRLLSDLFILTRSRMSPKVYFRVTAEDGRAIFKDVSREELRGDFDFIIETELASASEAEKQQRVSLMIQTLLNPTFLQTGVVNQGNLYEITKQFLLKHQIRNPDKFITRPPDHKTTLTPSERIFKILTNKADKPPIEQTVRPDEDHATALAIYEDFKESDQFGLIATPGQLGALDAVIQAHLKFQELLAGGGQGLPNQAGSQLPAEGGLPAAPAGGPGAGGAEPGPLGSPEGEPNGPVV